MFDEVIVQEEGRSDVDGGQHDWFRFREPSWWVEKLPQIGLADLWVGWYQTPVHLDLEVGDSQDERRA